MMIDLRCKDKFCINARCRASPRGRLLARVSVPNYEVLLAAARARGARYLGTQIEVVCPYDKRKKVLFVI